MEKSKVDINILGQDVSVMCTDDEKRIGDMAMPIYEELLENSI